MSSYHPRVMSDVCIFEVWCSVAFRGAWRMRGSGSARPMVRAAASARGGYAAFGYLCEVSGGEGWSGWPFAVVSWTVGV
jgi:hypothetical protein